MKRRTRWLLILGLPPLLLGVLLAAGLGLLRRTPEWYRPDALSPAEAAAAANRADQKILAAVDWAADVHGQAVREQIGAADPLAEAPVPQSATIQFTEDELNGFLHKWSQWHGWAQHYERFLADPAIVLEDERIIFAGRVKDMEAIASIHLRPGLDEQGRLLLRIDRVLGGRLPLPQAIFGRQKQGVIDALQARLPGWRGAAQVDEAGNGNDSAVVALAAKLVLNVLHQQPADAVLFLPAGPEQQVPVRITEVLVQDKTLTLTVTALDPEQRRALVEQALSETPSPTVRTE